MVRLLKSAIVGLGLTLLPFSLYAEEIEFNFQYAYNPMHIFYTNIAEPWIEELSEATNGELIVHLYQGGGLMKDPEVIASLMSGTLDMGSTGATFAADLLPQFIYSALPFLTPDSVHATALFEEMYKSDPGFKAEIDNVGKLLAIWGSDTAAIFSTSGPVTSPADMKGKRVLIWGGKQVPLVEAWGGIPVQVLASDTYIGLQRGMGELFLGPLPTGVSFQLMEVAKDVTPISAFVAPIAVWMSNDLWDYLSPEQQEIVVETTAHWGKETGQSLYNLRSRDIGIMEKNGVTFHNLTPEQLKVFQDLEKPVTIKTIADEFKRYGVNKDANEWYTYIEAKALATKPQ